MPRWFGWLMLWILFALAAIVVLLLHYLDGPVGADIVAEWKKSPSLIGAAIAGLVALIALLGNRFADFGHAEHERKTREEKASVALFNEIRLNLERQRASLALKEREKNLSDLMKPDPRIAAPRLRRQFASSPAGSHASSEKVATIDTTNFVYDSMKKEVLQLPVSVIGPVVAYYSLDDMVSKSLETNSRAHGLTNERRLKFYCAFYELATDADHAAVTALESLWNSVPPSVRTTLKVDRPDRRKPTIPLIDTLVREDWIAFPGSEIERKARDRVSSCATTTSPSGGAARGGSVEGQDGTRHGETSVASGHCPSSPS